MLKAKRRLAAVVDQVLDSLQDVPSSLQWSKDFNGAFMPVEPCENLPIQVRSGQIPEDLAGVHMRNGPNSQFWPPSKRSHVFDPDGMVHSIRIVNGQATYHCKYLETPRYKFEAEHGAEWFTRIGEMTGKVGLAKILGTMPSKARLAELEEWETGTANTAFTYSPNGRLWAHNELGPPLRFRLDEKGIPTFGLGFDTLEDTHRKPMSAHPKVDNRTGDIIFHGRELMKTFYVGRVVDGRVAESTELDLPVGFHHDMALTENFIVVIDGSMRFNKKGIVAGKPFWQFNPKQKLRFGVMPRSSKITADAFTWISADLAAELVHCLHAYDEDGKIVLWAPISQYEKGREDGILGGQGPNMMRRMVIDVNQKSVDVQEVEGGDLHRTEFGRIRDDRMGFRCRYGYSGIQSEGPDFNFTGIIKWDFDECRLAREINLPEGCVGGEPVFLPRNSSSTGDDDGYMGVYIWNPQKEESTWALYDAKTFSATPIVELVMPRRVPLGFHAHWVTEEQFQKQLHAP